MRPLHRHVQVVFLSGRLGDVLRITRCAVRFRIARRLLMAALLSPSREGIAASHLAIDLLALWFGLMRSGFLKDPRFVFFDGMALLS